jgi:hypothetical protein
LTVEGVKGCGLGQGMYPFSWVEENVSHVLLKCSDMQKQRECFLERKWLSLSEAVTINKTLGCTNFTELRNQEKIF